MAQAKPNFGSILDRAPTEVERPKPLPVGTYITQLVGLPRQDKSAKKGTEFVEFTHKILEAGEDVDTDDLQAYLTAPDGTKRKLSEVTVKNTFYLTENSIWRLKDFLKNCGFDVDDEKASLREMVEGTAGQKVGIVISHEASDDGQAIYHRVNKTLELE